MTTPNRLDTKDTRARWDAFKRFCEARQVKLLLWQEGLALDVIRSTSFVEMFPIGSGKTLLFSLLEQFSYECLHSDAASTTTETKKS